MGKTTGETMDVILDHLETLVDDGVSDVHRYTQAGIMEETGLDDPETVSKALQRLRHEEDLQAIRIGVMVFVPMSTKSDRVFEQLANHGYAQMRPYVSVFLGMGVAYLFMLVLGGSNSAEPFVAWQDGFAQAAVLGIALGALVHKLLTKLDHWRLKSADSFAAIVQLTLISVLLAGVFVGAYHLGISHYGRPFEMGIVVALAALAFAITIGYATYLHSRRGLDDLAPAEPDAES